MAPIDINNQEISSITLNGNTDIDTVEVNGQTVFSAGTSNLPVAYSNLVAWYPFDSATYGGSNADDVTAIIGGSGDDTAYNGTVSGATYQSSGGVTDISAGPNSGAFDFDGNSDFIGTGVSYTGGDVTFMAWARPTQPGNEGSLISGNNACGYFELEHDSSDIWQFKTSGQDGPGSSAITFNTYQHVAAAVDDSQNTATLFVDGVSVDSASVTMSDIDNHTINIGENRKYNQNFGGQIDDVRIYNHLLSGSEISNIYNNTKP